MSFQHLLPLKVWDIDLWAKMHWELVMLRVCSQIGDFWSF